MKSKSVVLLTRVSVPCINIDSFKKYTCYECIGYPQVHTIVLRRAVSTRVSTNIYLYINLTNKHRDIYMQNRVGELPAWLRLKCNEVLVKNPASLFSICVASIINHSAVDGYTELEKVQTLQFPPRSKSQPIEIIYKGQCTVLGCWSGHVCRSGLHRHVERLGHYKFWNTNCRQSRTCIEACFAHNPETTILNEINERQRLKRVSQTKQLSCKRKLF